MLSKGRALPWMDAIVSEHKYLLSRSRHLATLRLYLASSPIGCMAGPLVSAAVGLANLTKAAMPKSHEKCLSVPPRD